MRKTAKPLPPALAETTAQLERLDQVDDNSDRYVALLHMIITPAGRLIASSMAEQLAGVALIDEQLSRVENADRAWKTTQIASEVLQELTLHKALAEADAGKMSGMHIDKLLSRLKVVSANRDVLADADADRCVASKKPAATTGPAPAPQPKPKTGCAGCGTNTAPTGGLALLAVVFIVGLARRRREIRPRRQSRCQRPSTSKSSSRERDTSS